MGLFNLVIKSIIDNHKLLKIKKRIKNIYNPYFNNKEKFLILQKIDEKIDEEITSIYNEIKEINSIKFENAIKRYEELIIEIKKHNDDIELIDNNIVNFNYDSIIANPLRYNLDDLRQYLLFVDKIDKYNKKCERYIIFCEQVLEINKNYNFIVQQHNYREIYESIFNFKDEYYSLETKESIKNKLTPLINCINMTGKRYYDFSKIDDIDKRIKVHNDLFLEKHKDDAIFDNVQGRSLDTEQRIAVLKDEKSSLTIAGAGSGKTLTICGKVKYLIEEKNINPHDILLLSYSKKSADDLLNKIKNINDRLTVGTFHKLGLSILKETQNKQFNVEEQYNAIIESYFRDELKNRPHILKCVLVYYGLYLSSVSCDKKYNDPGEMFEELKKSDFRTLKTLTSLSLNRDKRETIKKELVKSYEEMAIANFYFINGIDYQYEKPYENNVSTIEKRQYTPDFYLSEYGIYHEHYGIDKDGNANQYEADEGRKYVDGIKWKRNIHGRFNTTCIETYSYEFWDGTIFNKLENELKSMGVVFKPLSNEEIYNTLLSIYNGENFKLFINLVKSFLSLYKSRYSDSTQFDEFLNSKYINVYGKKRVSLFLEIVKDIYLYYMDYIRSQDKIDFDDMIIRSSEVLALTDKFSYKYIIVDEFQDISYSRMIFLKKLIKKGNSKLFAVGDDWQAIYRFSGCDLSIFLKFDKYFEFAGFNYITSTHRNSQELQDIAGPFIKTNPDQFNKTIRSKKHLHNPIKIMYYDKNKSDGLNIILNSIYDINKEASVLLLGRNNRDIEEFYSNNFYKKKCNDKEIIISNDFPKFNIKYSTVHSSKGLEDEFVVIINADEGRLGFPNKVEDDDILNLVLSDNSTFEFAEERRLWYVALTRTKSYTYILVNNKKPSIFVEEIKDKCEIMNPEIVRYEASNIKCPHCKSGRLIIKKSEFNKTFYGCSNYPYCTYTIDDIQAANQNIRCSDCNDFMILRKGKYGLFYSCHGYPRCNNKKNLNN